MSTRQMKLGVVLTPAGGPGHPFAWLDDDIPGDASVDIDWYIQYTKLAEQAKFDLVFIVDSQFITANSPPHYLNRLEPLTLLSALAVATTHIGLAGTLTTSYNDPYNLARRLSSLDLISHGRAGWNVVTTGDAGTAGNYGRDEHYDYDTRYGRALEAVEVVKGLWDSYEDDAFPRDKAAKLFLDPSKQHQLNHHGPHFDVVGPLNIERSAQGHPVIFQAGDSNQGRDLGASIGEGIFTLLGTLERAKAFRDDIRSRAEAKGRDADTALILPGVRFFIGDTDEEARELERAAGERDYEFTRALAELGRPFGWHDFSQYDPDAPFPEIPDSALTSFRTQAEGIISLARSENLTLRQTVERVSAPTPLPFVGTAQTVADTLAEWFLDGGADGYLVFVDQPSQFRRFAAEVVPLLQQRGLFRTEYESTTLRGNLGLPVPENRHTAAGGGAPATAETTPVSAADRASVQQL